MAAIPAFVADDSSGRQARPGTSAAFPGGAALLDRAGRRGFVLIDDGSVRSLGSALFWAYGQSVEELHLLVETSPARSRASAAGAAESRGAPAAGASDGGDSQLAAGLIARRAGEWRNPPRVWAVEGREVVTAEAVPAPPEVSPDPELNGLARILADHGAEPTFESGILRGEVLGLEVARSVAVAGGFGLSVGVGRHDREARAEMAPDQDPAVALDEVVATVRALRRCGAPRHPANLLARERWLRRVLIAHPELVGAARLAPVGAAVPPAPDSSISSGPASAACIGEDFDGMVVVVACSTGIDVDLVPSGADVRACRARSARLVLAVPAGDDHPLTHRLAAALSEPATVVTVTRDWDCLEA